MEIEKRIAKQSTLQPEILQTNQESYISNSINEFRESGKYGNSVQDGALLDRFADVDKKIEKDISERLKASLKSGDKKSDEFNKIMIAFYKQNKENYK